MHMEKIKIDVWSDVVCPFCYLGKRKLEQALERAGLAEHAVVEWHSFQLDDSIPNGIGLPATEHIAANKGMAQSVLVQAQQRLIEQGKSYDIDFQFHTSLVINTQGLHRLLHWAKAFGKADALKTAFFKAHFTDGVDLSKTDQIKSIVDRIGLDGGAAINVLNSDTYSKEFQQDIALARQIKINGVPFFVFNGKLALSGAQPDHVFDEVLREVSAPSTPV
jgi:predicted DsbA family dithiol-disulfide isomerase